MHNKIIISTDTNVIVFNDDDSHNGGGDDGGNDDGGSGCDDDNDDDNVSSSIDSTSKSSKCFIDWKVGNCIYIVIFWTMVNEKILHWGENCGKLAGWLEAG